MTQEPLDRGAAAAPTDSPTTRVRSLRDELTSHEAKERYRSQMLSGIGGWSGTVVAAIPTAVFVAVNLVTTLRVAVYAAIGSAVLLAVYRLVRRQPVIQAVSGVVGVAIAAAIAGGTGEARNYFLIGILLSFGYGLAFVISMLVRRPLVGLLWEFLDPVTKHENMTAEPEDGSADTVETRHHTPWYRRRDLLKAYQLASAAGVVVFMGRGITQLILYLTEETTALGVTKIVLGTPLWLAGVVYAFWVVRRARHKLVAPPVSPAAPVAE